MSEEQPDIQWHRIVSIGEVMPFAMEVFGRMEKKRKEVAEKHKPQFAAAPEFKKCKADGSKLKKLWDETCMQSYHNGEFTLVYAPCPQCQDEANKIKRRAFWRKRGVPERVIDATMLNYDAATPEKTKAKNAAAHWLKRKKAFLILLGSAGTGKGHLAAACLKSQGDGLFITHADMLTDLRTSYVTHTTADLLERWKGAEMFVLDEFGLSAGGKDEEPMLYQVLADRHDKDKPTIITTNKSREEMRELLGFRLLDRIREDVTEVPMTWESHRTPRK